MELEIIKIHFRGDSQGVSTYCCLPYAYGRQSARIRYSLQADGLAGMLAIAALLHEKSRSTLAAELHENALPSFAEMPRGGKDGLSIRLPG